MIVRIGFGLKNSNRYLDYHLEFHFTLALINPISIIH